MKINKLMGIDFHHEIRTTNFKAKITEYCYGFNASYFLISSNLTLSVLYGSKVCKNVIAFVYFLFAIYT
jgi:hypothetical protein